jgi:hypothetical protein
MLPSGYWRTAESAWCTTTRPCVRRTSASQWARHARPPHHGAQCPKFRKPLIASGRQSVKTAEKLPHGRFLIANKRMCDISPVRGRWFGVVPKTEQRLAIRRIAIYTDTAAPLRTWQGPMREKKGQSWRMLFRGRDEKGPDPHGASDAPRPRYEPLHRPVSVSVHTIPADTSVFPLPGSVLRDVKSLVT